MGPNFQCFEVIRDEMDTQVSDAIILGDILICEILIIHELDKMNYKENSFLFEHCKLGFLFTDVLKVGAHNKIDLYFNCLGFEIHNNNTINFEGAYKVKHLLRSKRIGKESW